MRRRFAMAVAAGVAILIPVVPGLRGPVIHVLRNAMIGVTDNHRAKSILKLGMLLTYPLRYLDPLLTRTRSSYNAGCAFYFCGRKRGTLISDREILTMFRGA
jgi:hypothetical protein